MATSGRWLAAALTAGLISLAACSSPGSALATGGSATTGAHVVSTSPYSVRIGPYTQVYSSPLPSDPALAGVMVGFRTAQVLWGRSNEAFRQVAPVTAYVTGNALKDMNAALATERHNDYVPSGTERFFDTKVTRISSTTATVTTCDDGSKYRTEDVHTGTDLPRAPASQLYIFEIWDMVAAPGHWAIADLSLVTLPDRRASACQPSRAARR